MKKLMKNFGKLAFVSVLCMALVVPFYQQNNTVSNSKSKIVSEETGHILCPPPSAPINDHCS